MTTNTGATAPGPVQARDRIAYLDVLRGFAVMAIFIVNIKAMAMPFAYYTNPGAWATEADRLVAIAQKFVVDDKWRTIFTALYGAGLAMIAERLAVRGVGRGILWRRNAWLLLFGLIHLIGIWGGDILTAYALAGFVAVFLVGQSVGRLFLTACAMLVIGWLWTSVFGIGPAFDAELEAKLGGMFWETGSDATLEELAAFQGGIGDQLAARAEGAKGYILYYYLLGGHWLVTLGLMVMGMALFRVGFLQGETPPIRALVIAVVGLALSFGLEAFQLSYIANNGSTFAAASIVAPLATLDGWAGAVGYAALVTFLLRIGVRLGRVGAVGRMAFTNYITCSLVGTTLGGGHALGWYGQVTLVQLMAVVAVTLLAMLIWSPLWLRYFRFGPLEWVWRSLVYQRIQPFRRAA